MTGTARWCPAVVPEFAGVNQVITSHHTFAVRFIQGSKVKPSFLYHLLLAPTARRRCRGFAIGTTVLAVPRDALLDFQFALPASDRLDEFEHLGRLHRDRIEANEDQCEVLARTRDALLPKLISGEIRVPPDEEEEEGA